MVALAVASILIPSALAGYVSMASNNLGVYWGQNSQGGKQQRLSHFCEHSPINIISISFLSSLKRPSLNLANITESCNSFPGSKLVYCPTIDEDIKICQARWGKTILLSLGGEAYTEAGFNTPREARDTAEKIWQTFGPSSSRSSLPRPFGNAIIDGIDLHFEDGKNRHMLHFAKELRRLMNESPHRPDINKYLLTASPRCVIPKPTKNGLLNGGLALDAIFVRFYNDICGLESFTTSKPSFNFEAWSQWAEQLTTLENVKVFLGVPASPSATTSGYATTRELREIVALVKTSSSFGGLMLWEASQLDENWGFMKGVAAILGAMPSQEIEPAAPIEKPRIELGHRPKSESADFYQHVLVAKSGKSLAGSLSTKSTSVAVRNGRFRRLILRQ